MLEILGRQHYGQLHRMMLLQNFPETPEDYAAAEAAFLKAELLGVFEGSCLKVVFILADEQQEGAFLDVICQPGFEGKWASKALLKQLYDYVFQHKKYRYLWVQPRRKAGLRAALKAGFRYLSACKTTPPLLLLSKTQPLKWNN